MPRKNYAIEQRMRFIDFLLWQYGTLNRRALMDYYGISVPQASKDIADYMKLAPGNIDYDGKLKTYVKTTNFHRIY